MNQKNADHIHLAAEARNHAVHYLFERSMALCLLTPAAKPNL
jgi:hypothetical protein